MTDDKSNIPRTNDSHPSGDVHKREHLPDAANIAPDSDGLVCEHCGERVVARIGLITIQAYSIGVGMHKTHSIARSKVCTHCYKIAADRIKNILGKVV